MEFNELLRQDVVPTDDAVLSMLKKSQWPTVLYGATPDVADQIVKRLRATGIGLARVAADEFSPAKTADTELLKDYEPIPIEAIDAELPAYNVVLGFVKAYADIDGVRAKFRNARSVSYLSEIFEMEYITTSFIRENKDYLEDLYHRLSDQRSKDSFVAYLMAKSRQDMKYLPAIFERTQYFPQGIFELTDKESYFDCGAFVGDTIADFLKATGGRYHRIWAAEPDINNFRQLQKYVEKEGLKNIEIINKGVYSASGRLPFRTEGSMLSKITDDSLTDNSIETDTIDNIAAGAPVTYIKFDVEGAELEALKGAEQTILRHHPIMGVSIYHRERDFIDIPTFIDKLADNYKFYFRAHKKLAFDAVLYCV